MKFLIRASLLITIILCSCRKDDNDPIPYPQIKFEGKFEQSPVDPVDPADLTIISVTDETGVSDDGTFELKSAENTKYQFFFVESKVSGDVVYYGISNPGTGKVLVNDSTTALGLLMINPFLIGSEQEQREQFLNKAIDEGKFSSLIAAIKLAHKDDPHLSLDLDKHPEIYQLATEVMMSAFEKLGAGSSPKGDGNDERPIAIVGATGNDVIFKNYRHIYYGAELFYPSTLVNEDFLLSRAQKVMEWRWWPLSEIGFHLLEPAETRYTLKDGYVNMDFYGFSPGMLSTEWNARDKAITYNILTGILYGLDIISGLSAKIPDNIDLSFIAKELIHNPELANIGISISEGDNGKLLTSIIKLISSDLSINFFINYCRIDLKRAFAEAALKKLNVAMQVIDVLGYANEHFPFFHDLLYAPRSQTNVFRIENNKLVLEKSNKPPEVSIKATPTIGYKETSVTFAANYFDDYTPEGNALFEWKWVADGDPDGAWSAPSSNPDTVLLNLSKAGYIYLKVDDRMSEEKVYCSKYLPFYEEVKRNRIIVLGGHLLGVYPDFLENELSYKADNSELRYVLTHPAEWVEGPGIIFNQAILNPQTDLLVIDAYPESFGEIECFQANKLAIMRFVRNGGGLLLITADIFENESSTGALPLAKIETISNKVIRNSNSNWSFIEGEEMDFHLSVAFSDTNIPDGAIIHLVNEYGDPQLIEMYNGKGNILSSIFGINSLNSDSVDLNTFWYMTGAKLNNR